MRASFTLFLVSVAVATALQPPKSFVSNPHLRGGNTDTDVESNLHHGRTLLTGLPPVTYTTDAHFDTGSLVSVNHEDVLDQLQLDSESKPFNFMWVACSNRGTVVKVDTINGTVLGEYRSAPDNVDGNPSRTTVDQFGNVWLTNRANIGPNGYGTMVHIGLKENNQCKDRNGNGKIDTSTGLNNIMAWSGPDAANAEDECILHYTEVNSKGTQHVSIDKDNNVWVGGYELPNSDLIDGETGKIIKSYPSVGFGGNVGLMDKKGFLWSSSPLLRWDSNQPLEGSNGDPGGNDIAPLAADKYWGGQYSPSSYRLCIDSKGNVWNTEWRAILHKYDSDGRYLGTFSHGFPGAQGCVVDGNDDVWVAHSLNGNTVGHLKSDGTYVGTVTLESGPTGVAVDGKGKVWSINRDTSTLSRIDPAKNGGVGEVDRTVDLGYGCGPYNYGDMTGSTNTAPPNTGTWTVVHDSGGASTNWGRIKWTADVPGDSSLTVQVSSDGISWSDVTEGEELSEKGPKLHVLVNFKRATTGESPVLFELSLITNERPDCSKAVASPSDILPLDNKFHSVVVHGVTDRDSDKATIKVTSIFQDEPQRAMAAPALC